MVGTAMIWTTTIGTTMLWTMPWTSNCQGLRSMHWTLGAALFFCFILCFRNRQHCIYV